MRLSRPKLTHRAASAPVAPTLGRPKGEQTLMTLRMLQNMGYKEVWCQTADVNEATLNEAAQEGWRVGSISDNRIKMVLGHQPPSPLVPAAQGTPPTAASTPGRGARPALPRNRPSEQSLHTRATTPPYREPSPSPVARLPKGALSPQVAALIAETQGDTGLGDLLPPLSPGEVLSPGMRRMYLRTQEEGRRPSDVSHRSQASQSSQKSSVPSVVVSPPMENSTIAADYFSYQPRDPPRFRRTNRPPSPPLPASPRRPRDSASSSYTIDRIADALYDPSMTQPLADTPELPESPASPTPPALDSALSEDIRFEVEERRPVHERLQRALGQPDDYSYIFLPVTPQVEAGVSRRPSAPGTERLAPAADPVYSSSDPGHGHEPPVATPPIVPPRWNGLNRKQTPHRRS